MYGMKNHNHEQRFSEDRDTETKIPDTFQSDCDIINHRLYVCYNFILLKINMNIIFLT